MDLVLRDSGLMKKQSIVIHNASQTIQSLGWCPNKLTFGLSLNALVTSDPP